MAPVLTSPTTWYLPFRILNETGAPAVMVGSEREEHEHLDNDTDKTGGGCELMSYVHCIIYSVYGTQATVHYEQCTWYAGHYMYHIYGGLCTVQCHVYQVRWSAYVPSKGPA